MRPAVRHVEEFSCTFTDYLGRRKERVFSCNNIVILSGLGLQSLRLSNREAKGIRPFAADCFDVIVAWFYARDDGKYILDNF